MKKAKAYLYRLKTLNNEIEESLRQLEKLRADMFGMSGMDYSKDRVQVSPEDRLSDAMAKYVDLDAEINRMIDRYVDLKREVIRRIRGMENKAHREILFRKFVKFQSVREIGAAMKKSKSWVFEKQAEAIKDFKAQYLVAK